MHRNPVKGVLTLLLTLVVVLSGSLINTTMVEAAAPKPKSITLNAKSKTLYTGKSYTLKVKSVKPAKASKSVSFKSSKKTVATVTSKGVIKAKKAGTATITVTSKVNKKVKATCKITVKQRVTGLTLNKPATAIKKGSKITLKASIKPKNATDKRLTWKSSKSAVASVSSKGVVTGKKAGTATITVSARDGSGKKATCMVGVYTKKVSSATISAKTKTLNVGKTFTLSIKSVKPSGASKVFTWKSSKTGVATVDAVTGKVTAKKPGKATITGTAADGSKKTVKCTVTVVQPVTGVTVSPNALTLTVGQSGKLTATVKPSNASKKTINWSSSNANVVSVAGGTVTARAQGTAVITAAAADGSGKKATCTVTVNPIKVSSITLSPTAMNLTVGATGNITATVLPANAANRGLNWSSSNANVASVAGGIVTARGKGTAVITAAAADGSGRMATCTVNVADPHVPVSSVSLDKTSLELKANGKPVTLTAAIVPANATNQSVTWTSSDTAVATVAGGMVTPVGDGTANITVTTADGQKSAVCSVTVIGKESARKDAEGNYRFVLDKSAESFERVNPAGDVLNTVTAVQAEDYAGKLALAAENFYNNNLNTAGKLTTDVIGQKWAAGDVGFIARLLAAAGMSDFSNITGIEADITDVISDTQKVIEIKGAAKVYRFLLTLTENKTGGTIDSYDLKVEQLGNGGAVVRTANLTDLTLDNEFMSAEQCWAAKFNFSLVINSLPVDLTVYAAADGSFIKAFKDDDMNKLFLNMEETESSYILEINKTYYAEIITALQPVISIEDIIINNVY